MSFPKAPEMPLQPRRKGLTTPAGQPPAAATRRRPGTTNLPLVITPLPRGFAGRPVKAICAAVGHSEVWFHKWWDRYLRAGPDGLYDLTRANHHVAHRIPPELERRSTRSTSTRAAEGPDAGAAPPGATGCGSCPQAAWCRQGDRSWRSNTLTFIGGEYGRDGDRAQPVVPGGKRGASGRVPAAGGGHRAWVADGVSERAGAEVLALQVNERPTAPEHAAAGGSRRHSGRVMRWRKKDPPDFAMRWRIAAGTFCEETPRII